MNPEYQQTPPEQPPYQPGTPPQIPSQLVPPQQSPPQYQTASGKKHRHINWWMVAAALLAALFFAALGFGVWTFNERNRYRDDTQSIVDEAVEKAIVENTAKLEAEFVEREKEPLVTYTGPAPFGEVKISYPKTWSAFVSETGQGTTPVEGYFHPDFVPSTAMGRPYALRLEVIDRAFDREVARFDSAVRRGRLESRPITVEKVPDVTGTRLDGEIARGREGSIVLFPLRDKTLRLSVQATRYRGDFNNIILPNLEFNP